MKKKSIIYIVIETAKREVDAKTLLALKALKENYRVVIGQKGALRSLVKHTNPGIILLKSFGPRNTNHINFLKDNNFIIVSNDEEIIVAMEIDDKINWRMNNDNLNKLDLLLCVGEESDYSIIKKNFKKITDKTLVCGNIRLELLKEKYRKLLEKDFNNIKKKFGNYILFLTSFPQINKIRENFQIDFVYNRIVENNIDPDSKHIFLANEQVLMQREILIETIKFLDNFEKNFPNKKLVISPHPNEKFDFWKNYIAKRKFKNIFLNADKVSSSSPLINNCEMLISSNSTSLLEAHFLEKKKIINLLSKNPRPSEIDLLKKISKVVRSSEQLSTAIKYYDKIKHEPQIKEELKEIKNSEKNFDSFERILERFKKLNGTKTYPSIYKNRKSQIYLNVINQFRVLKNLIKGTIGYKNKKKKMIVRFHKEKIGNSLQKDNFIENTKHINSVVKIENLLIKQIIPEVFLLDKNE